MLATGEPGQLSRWRAHYEKKPFGYGPASMIVSSILNFVKVQMAEFGGTEKELKEKDLYPLDYFVPRYGKRGRRVKTRGIKPIRGAGMVGTFKAMARVQ